MIKFEIHALYAQIKEVFVVFHLYSLFEIKNKEKKKYESSKKIDNIIL